MEMTIGKLAKQAGVGVETVRFYERKGLIKRPSKRPGGFRTYSKDEASRIRFVKRAQEVGFTLREIKELLDVQFKRKMTGAEVRDMAQSKIKEIRGKITDLKRMETSLTKLAQVCGDGDQAIRECKIFGCFEEGC